MDNFKFTEHLLSNYQQLDSDQKVFIARSLGAIFKERNIDINSTNQKGEPLSYLFVYYTDWYLLQAFLNLKPNIDHRDQRDCNLYLFTTAYGSQEDILLIDKYYKEHSKDKNFAVTKSGQTTMDFAYLVKEEKEVSKIFTKKFLESISNNKDFQESLLEINEKQTRKFHV